ncbi:MAG: leucyl aminopeptidase [Gammaproteobacteria bacterium]|nr:leucyl aminopeptidase [Gammaproteobacteria bacterium]
MDYVIKQADAISTPSDCLIVGVHTQRHLSPAAAALDQATKGFITRLYQHHDLTGKLGQIVVIPDLPDFAARRVLLVGCGARGKMTKADWRKCVDAMARALMQTPARHAVSCLSEIEVNGLAFAEAVEQQIVAVDRASYRFDRFKSKNPDNGPVLRKLTLLAATAADLAVGKHAARCAAANALGIRLARDLGNAPANHCTPSYLAEQARQLAKLHRTVTTRILEEAQMRRLGMGALLAVTRGSHEPAKLIVLQYTGAASTVPPIALVGKGVTFDSGGISIKPAAQMDEMKFDMSGAASVLGTFAAVAELKLPINLVGVIPAAENLPGGCACKPGDVITTLSGQTVEILNTDAEGRLLLCDALTYCARFKPEVVIDIATLTGACVIALGEHASGLLANDDELANDLLAAGEEANDRVWRLPLWEEYQQQLDSNFADMANVGGRSAGTITGACFLARFTHELRWAHLDIAGTAYLQGKQKGSTGRPVGLLLAYLRRRAAQAAASP